MGRCWNFCVTLSVISLLFVMIPFHIDKSIDDDKSNDQKLQSAFAEYVKKFNKSYLNDSKEYSIRFNNFKESMKAINTLNHLSEGSPDHRAKYGPTIHSDLSKEEFKELRLSDEKPTNNLTAVGNSWREHPLRLMKNKVFFNKNTYYRRKRATIDGGIPMQMDWRKLNAVGSVYNQGVCGACWAFSTVETIESMVAIKTGTLQQLSVQQSIDCAGEGNHGCLGGDICTLLDWLKNSDTAILAEQTYPLQFHDKPCTAMSASSGPRVASFTCDDFSKSEDEILLMLATHGPVAVAVNAASWQHYLGGVIRFHCSGSRADLNHAVQLVGYDKTAEVPFYIARNSWGTEFGDNGYLRLAIGSNVCGLANEVSSIDVYV